MTLVRRERILLLVLLVLVVGVGGWLGSEWYFKDVDKLKAEKAVKAADLQRVEEKVRDLAAIEQRLTEAKKLQEDYDRLVPRGQELPQLLRDTATMLEAAGVDLVSYTPGAVGPAPEVPELSQKIVAVSSRGTYAETLRMFDALRSARRLIGVKDFSLSRAGGGNDPILNCQFNMVVFFANQ